MVYYECEINFESWKWEFTAETGTSSPRRRGGAEEDAEEDESLVSGSGKRLLTRAARMGVASRDDCSVREVKKYEDTAAVC